MEEQIVRKWIDKHIDKKGWNQWDDLHLDEIHNRYTDKSLWVDAGVELLGIAQAILESENLEAIYFPVVFYPLFAEDDAPRGINFKSLHEINNEFDITPPSISIIPYNDEYLNLLLQPAEYIMSINKGQVHVYYHETLRPNEIEYSRNVRISFVLREKE
jgi:hypothetical protein